MASIRKRRADEIRGYVETWLPRMRLGHWNVTVEIRAANKASEPATLADIACRPRYLEADMTVYPYMWDYEQSSAKYREHTIVHELSHIYLSPLDALFERLRGGTCVNSEQWDDAKEVVTESVSRAIVQ